jgi:hypothetical protein
MCKSVDNDDLVQVAYLCMQKKWTTREFLIQFYNTNVREGSELILAFVLIFARFEDALKKSGYVKNDRNGVACVQWKTFTDKIEPDFKKENIITAVNYILANPPKNQTWDNEIKKLKWVDRIISKKCTEIEILSLLIRGVRNNLFHGGKLDGTYRDWTFRNYTLLNSVITILEEWINLNDDVKNNFSNFE